MSETASPEIPAPEMTLPPAEAAAGVPDLGRSLDELRRRVQVLEERVAGLQDTRQLEERITERVTTLLPAPVPPPPPAPEPPGPGVLAATVQSSWLLVELIGEARTLVQMLFDRRYNMAWLARVLAVLLVVAIFTSGLWFPLSSLIPFFGGTIDKLLDLCLALLLFLLLSREVRRYRDWRGGRRF